MFVFRDRATRRDDVLAFYGDGASVRPLAFAATIKDMKALLHNALNRNRPAVPARPSAARFREALDRLEGLSSMG